MRVCTCHAPPPAVSMSVCVYTSLCVCVCAGWHQLAVVPQQVQAPRHPVRRHGSGQDTHVPVHAGGRPLQPTASLPGQSLIHTWLSPTQPMHLILAACQTLCFAGYCCCEPKDRNVCIVCFISPSFSASFTIPIIRLIP